jgi:hypothetical protein
MDPYLERHWVNLVEIDLTRDGNRALLVPVLELPAEKRTTYLACVFRAAWKKYGRKEAYPIFATGSVAGDRHPAEGARPGRQIGSTVARG